MSLTVPALLTPSAGAPFERGTVERRELGEHDVLIDIAYAGICHSDIHQAREEWGKAIFPMVPGHEIAGVVSRRRLRRDQARRRRPRRASAASSTPAASARAAWPARSSSA